MKTEAQHETSDLIHLSFFTEIGTAIAGGLAPLGALSMVAASTTHSTDGVVIILAIASVLVVVFALCDQGRKHSAFKN